MATSVAKCGLSLKAQLKPSRDRAPSRCDVAMQTSWLRAASKEWAKIPVKAN